MVTSWWGRESTNDGTPTGNSTTELCFLPFSFPVGLDNYRDLSFFFQQERKQTKEEYILLTMRFRIKHRLGSQCWHVCWELILGGHACQSEFVCLSVWRPDAAIELMV